MFKNSLIQNKHADRKTRTPTPRSCFSRSPEGTRRRVHLRHLGFRGRPQRGLPRGPGPVFSPAGFEADQGDSLFIPSVPSINAFRRELNPWKAQITVVSVSQGLDPEQKRAHRKLGHHHDPQQSLPSARGGLCVATSRRAVRRVKVQLRPSSPSLSSSACAAADAAVGLAALRRLLL